MDKTEMNAIMQERIEKFNQHIMSQDIEKIPIGLFSGKMGICIYFFHQARLTKNKKYEKFAEKLLDSIYSQIHLQGSIDIEDGLAGICLGIDYLIEEKFVKGNVNSILKELDDTIYRNFNFQLLSNDSQSDRKINFVNVFEIVKLSLYLCKRLENEKLPQNEKYLFEKTIIKALTKVESAINSDLFVMTSSFSLVRCYLPIFLILLSRLYKLKFYNYKIEKIIDELSFKLFSIYPLLQSNRLLLSVGMRSINHMDKTIWQEHILLLESKVDLTDIIKTEFRNKNIFADEGISGFYFLLMKTHNLTSTNNDLIANKIITSNVWYEFLKDEKNTQSHIGLVTGFCGVILSYLNTQNCQ